jgi:hypothetical protein
MSEPHDVVKLLVARMESHPEEFTPDEGGPYEVRWEEYVTGIEIHGNETDKTAIRAGLRDILLGKIHEEVLDELLNGPDKRRKEAEENEYERHLAQSLQHMKQQQMAVQQSALGQYQNAMGQYQNALSAGELSASLGQANQAAGSLSETINRLKQALGAKK